MDTIKREVRPTLIERPAGGWLAVSPSNCGLSVGIDAPTKEEAIARFRSMFSRWLEILALK